MAQIVKLVQEVFAAGHAERSARGTSVLNVAFYWTTQLAHSETDDIDFRS